MEKPLTYMVCSCCADAILHPEHSLFCKKVYCRPHSKKKERGTLELSYEIYVLRDPCELCGYSVPGERFKVKLNQTFSYSV